MIYEYKRCLLLAIAVVLVPMLTVRARGNDGLVAHYTFDEGKGDKLLDHSGKGNHGKIIGPQWQRLKEGYALKFDGKDDYVDCGNDKSLDVAKEGTVEIWFRPTAGKGGLLTWHTGSGWPDERLVLAFSHRETDDSVLYVLADGNFYSQGKWAPPKMDQWTHYALSFSGTQVRQYCNGRLLNEWDQNYMIPDFGGAPLRLGVSKGLGPPHYAGLLDEIRVYNRALSPAEVFNDFAKEAAKKGKAIPQRTKRLTARARTLLEEGTIILAADAREFHPIPAGASLHAEVSGTDIKQIVPLDPRLWAYSVTLNARKLMPGDYAATLSVTDANGRAIGQSARVTFRWRKPSLRPDSRRAMAQALNEPNPFYIVRDGQPQATIVIPRNADKWTQKAAGWLVQYVKKSTGAVLRILQEGKPVKGNLISVGHTGLMKKAGITTQGLKYDGPRMVVRGRTLFLFGRDELQFDIQGAKGTCKAVVTFLEDLVGVRWYLPGDEGAFVPSLKHVAVSSKLDTVFNPVFVFSHGRYAYGMGTPSSFANHFRTALKVKSYGGHSYYGWLPEKKYFKDHPEYFALIGGKRVGRQNHLCSSNPDVAKILLREIRKDFDRGYDWVSLAQEDGYARCQCERCEALDNYRGMTSRETPCERLLLLHKWIADQCNKSHPNKTVHMIVYGPTTWPSKKFDKVGDNVVLEMCNQTPAVVGAWKGKARAMTGYLYWFDTTGGKGMGIHATVPEVAEKIRYLHEHGFVGLYQIPETNWGLQGPSYYAIGKLMGDPYLDYRALQKEYCLGVFGKQVGDTMNEFFNVLYAMPRVHAKIWPEKSIQKLDAILRKAEGQVKLNRQRKWVKLTRDHFDYSCLLSRMLTAYSAYKANPSDETWNAVKTQVTRFDAYRNRILRYSDRHTKAFFPGHDNFCRFLAAKYVGYYNSYKARKAEVLKKGIEGTRAGWRGGGVAVPLTLDFTKPPHRAKKK